MVRNPFHHLYVGEKVDPNEFVRIFSQKLVEHATPLFQSGHVVLSGVQGSGKSMLFKLFDPAVRIAYADAEEEFPIPNDYSNFIGAGVNINTSRCNEFGNRKIGTGNNTKEILFGDFFNYLVSYDIINSVCKLAEHRIGSRQLQLRWDEQRIHDFVETVRQSPVWEGYLTDINSLEELKLKMGQREILYRRFLNYNDKELDSSIAMSKTAVGQPMKVIISAFKTSGIVRKDTDFFVLIDQYEELATIKDQGDDADYRSVINKCINRDPSLSYRIGTRGYAWRNHLTVFGSDHHLEQDRDYKLVELDAKLKPHEIGGTSIYPEFATDVFRRRLKVLSNAGAPIANAAKISDALGNSLSPKEEALRLTGKSPSSVVQPDKDWPENIVKILKEIASNDPLSAKLGEVWLRQKQVIDDVYNRSWDDKSKQYWRKERVELALLRIAGIRKQRAIYSGENDILALSGRNILVFLSICQYIWDYASQASSERGGHPEFPISHSIQTISVFQTAKTWLDRIPFDYGRSDDRFKLIQLLGEKFATSLHANDKMSYPGHNGISLSIEDLMEHQDLSEFLIEAVDYGNLTVIEHATKNRDRKRRLKFYLNPLYCVIFRIPYQHTKEPWYIKAGELKQWLSEVGVLGPRQRSVRRRRASTEQELPLLDILTRSND